jgi:hypothetical protein
MRKVPSEAFFGVNSGMRFGAKQEMPKKMKKKPKK